MNPILKEALGSIIRHVLGFGAAFLVTSGVWQQADAEKYVAAAAIGILAVGWSLWQKYKSRIKLLTALGTPATMSEEQLENGIRSSAKKPQVSTPKTDIPNEQ